MSRRDVAEAVGLTRLPFQAVDLAFQFCDDIVEPFEIGFGCTQAQFGLMAARMQPGDAGRLLKQCPTGLWFGLDKFGDPALTDHRRRAGTGGLVSEQELDVARARIATVDLVGRTGLALDAAGDLQCIVVVEGGGRGARRVVEEQRHLGHVARGARRRARKDDIVHARGAHVLV